MLLSWATLASSNEDAWQTSALAFLVAAFGTGVSCVISLSSLGETLSQFQNNPDQLRQPPEE